MKHLEGEAWFNSRRRRYLDRGLAALAMPFTAPVVLGSAALVSIADRVNPMFTQTRVGRGTEHFTIFKIRTMPDENNDTASDFFDDDRRSRVGNFLSNARIDEVPQLVNVLAGNMSWIGLRPLVPDVRQQIMDSLNSHEQREWDKARTIAPAGMFDPFNLAVFRGDQAFDQVARVPYDIEYAMGASLKTDVAIIGDCIKVALQGRRELAIEDGVTQRIAFESGGPESQTSIADVSHIL